MGLYYYRGHLRVGYLNIYTIIESDYAEYQDLKKNWDKIIKAETKKQEEE
jgi:hypothetical protein